MGFESAPQEKKVEKSVMEKLRAHVKAFALTSAIGAGAGAIAGYETIKTQGTSSAPIETRGEVDQELHKNTEAFFEELDELHNTSASQLTVLNRLEMFIHENQANRPHLVERIFPYLEERLQSYIEQKTTEYPPAERGSGRSATYEPSRGIKELQMLIRIAEENSNSTGE